MKKLLLIILLLPFFLFPKNTYALPDIMRCRQVSSIPDVNNGNLIIVSRILNYNPNNTGYTLTLLEGENKEINTSQNISPISGTNDADVTFTIPNYKTKDLGLTKVDDHVSFRITEEGTEHHVTIPTKLGSSFTLDAGGRDCTFDVNVSENIADAINDYQSVATCTDSSECPQGSTCLIGGSQGRSNICVDNNGSVVGTGGSNTTLPEPTCTPSTGGEGIDTAIGCLPTDPGDFTNLLLTRGISIAAGLALMLMIFGAFSLITSAGNPDAVKKGKEIITSALIGLLFIIFSVFLLKLIGVDILKIPTLTSSINQDARPGGLGH